MLYCVLGRDIYKINMEKYSFSECLFSHLKMKLKIVNIKGNEKTPFSIFYTDCSIDW